MRYLATRLFGDRLRRRRHAVGVVEAESTIEVGLTEQELLLIGSAARSVGVLMLWKLVQTIQLTVTNPGIFFYTT